MFELQNLINSKDYLIGTPTIFHILTIKNFYEEDKLDSYQYTVIVVKNDNIIAKDSVESKLKKNLLTLAKRKGIKLLINYNPKVRLEDVTMVHYKPDRPNKRNWTKEPKKSLENLLKEI